MALLLCAAGRGIAKGDPAGGDGGSRDPRQGDEQNYESGDTSQAGHEGNLATKPDFCQVDCGSFEGPKRAKIATTATLEPSKRYAPMGSTSGLRAGRLAGGGSTVSGIRRAPRRGPARRRLEPPHSRHDAVVSPRRRHGDAARLRRELPGSGQTDAAGWFTIARLGRETALLRFDPPACGEDDMECEPLEPRQEVLENGGRTVLGAKWPYRDRGHDPALHAARRQHDLYPARRRNPWNCREQAGAAARWAVWVTGRHGWRPYLHDTDIRARADARVRISS